MVINTQNIYLQVMSPDKNFEWFKQRGWIADKMAEVHKLVVDQFRNSYCTAFPSPPTAPASLSVTLVPPVDKLG